MAHPEVSHAGRRLAAAGDLELVVPDCPKGIGSVIGSPESDAVGQRRLRVSTKMPRAGQKNRFREELMGLAPLIL